MVKVNNYSFLKYLNFYDLVNKYNFKSIYLLPQVNKINLKIAIEQSIALKLQYKAFLFYYLYNFCCSKVILNFFIELKKKLKTVSLKSKIMVDISYKKIIDFLILLNFFINNKSINSHYIESKDNSNLTSGKPQYKSLYLIFSVPAIYFFNKINKKNMQINFNDLVINYKFLVKKLL